MVPVHMNLVLSKELQWGGNTFLKHVSCLVSSKIAASLSSRFVCAERPGICESSEVFWGIAARLEPICVS